MRRCMHVVMGLALAWAGPAINGRAQDTNTAVHAENARAEPDEDGGIGWGPITLGGAVVVGGIALAGGGGGGGGGGSSGGDAADGGGSEADGEAEDLSFKGLVAANLWDGGCASCEDAYSLNQTELNADLSGVVRVEADGQARIVKCRVTLKSDIVPQGLDPSCPTLAAGTYSFDPGDASAKLIIARARAGDDVALEDGILGNFSASGCDIGP